jgi:predicted metal-binding protein
LIFLPGRNDSPPSEFTDIAETFKLIRKYNREALLVKMMRDSERDGLYDID